MRFTLYYMPGACSLAEHIALEWAGASYEAIKTNPRDPSYLKINPAGAVPALRDGDGPFMAQNGALLHYLAACYPDANLGPPSDSPQKAYDLNHWLDFMTGDLHPAFGPYFRPQRFTVSEHEKTVADIKEASFALIDKRMKLLDAHLKDKDYMVYGRRSIADAYVFPMLRWVTGLPGGLSPYPHAQRYFKLWSGDEGIMRALEQEGLL